MGAKRYYLDAYSLNPNTVIKGMTGIDITDDSYDRFELNAKAGYRSIQQLQGINAGLEAELHISKRFSIDVEGEYMLSEGKFRPAIHGAAKYSIIKR